MVDAEQGVTRHHMRQRDKHRANRPLSHIGGHLFREAAELGDTASLLRAPRVLLFGNCVARIAWQDSVAQSKEHRDQVVHCELGQTVGCLRVVAAGDEPRHGSQMGKGPPHVGGLLRLGHTIQPRGGFLSVA